MKTHNEVRSAFLAYFEQNGHRVVSTYSLIPPDDPTLLFVNAGMVQFKDVFTGLKSVPYKRATTSQKCLRVSGKHNDLENVGRTARHHTFFEMLGNFSFGDYFKKDAIRFGWEFLTEVLGLDKSKLWVSVHPDDDEAYTMWANDMGVPEERIFRDPENFWSMGDTGACGPCSEIYIDQGPVRPGWEDAVIGDESDRFLELWNLVFMQFERHPDGSLTELPNPSIDTGMGLERILAVLRGQISNYDTDLFQPLIQVVVDHTGGEYKQTDEPYDVACRVLADHSRAAAFLIADGVYPSNEGRGYVLRRVLRRAIRFGRQIGLNDASISLVADKVVDVMAEAYPELEKSRGVIQRVLTQEEDRFGRTLADGERLLERSMADVKKSGQTELPGNVAFTLYDTHGFPLDLTELIGREAGFTVDREGFEAALDEQRARSRQNRSANVIVKDDTLDGLVEKGGESTFLGYDQDSAEGAVLAMSQDGVSVNELTPGKQAEIILDSTPFYAESGGQVGDIGTITTAEGARFTVTDTQKHGPLIRHIGTLEDSAMQVGNAVSAAVDSVARDATRGSHSATHLLHLALREVLGEHVRQRGSLVSPDRVRFDFSHFGPMTDEEVEQVEGRVNALVRANHEAQTDIMSFDDAVKSGAMAFFEEKYGDEVRVLKMGPSIELCGGTHVGQTGEIGFFAVTSEGSLASGVRRIEARTGVGVLQHVHDIRRAAQQAARALNSGVGDLPDKVQGLLKSRRELEKSLEKAIAAQASGRTDLTELASVGDVPVHGLRLTDADGKSLLPMLDELRAQSGRGVVLITNAANGRLALALGVSDSFTDSLHAGNLLREALTAVNGRGGGNARSARGGLDQADPETIEKLEGALVNAVQNTAG
ncbi:MAG: alanine--tRNA ligase [Myxococcales bacterium]|nr:alanine--tRNA ligase [Myxococcales bacterium]